MGLMSRNCRAAADAAARRPDPIEHRLESVPPMTAERWDSLAIDDDCAESAVITCSRDVVIVEQTRDRWWFPTRPVRSASRSVSDGPPTTSLQLLIDQAPEHVRDVLTLDQARSLELEPHLVVHVRPRHLLLGPTVSIVPPRAHTVHPRCREPRASRANPQPPYTE